MPGMLAAMRQSVNQIVFGLFQQHFQGRFHKWLKRRVPPSNQVVLDHRKIFILPTRQGLGFGLVLAMMFVGAINYEASLAFALVFLLLGMFLLTILYTFRNLSGMKLSAKSASSVFAETDAPVELVLERNSKRLRESIVLRFKGSRPVVADLINNESVEKILQVYAKQRGYFRPGRLIVETFFPFGLCRAWSLIDLSIEIIVFPKPVICDLDWLIASNADSGQINLNTGNDDFHGLRDYQEGDSLKHVAWKNFARGQGMYTKQYSSNVDERLWLNWDMFPDMGMEERLSRLCYCVLELDSRDIDYGLKLPGLEISPAKGSVHYQQTLRALATFGLEADGSERIKKSNKKEAKK